MDTLTNEAIKSRIEALKNSHAQNNNAVTSTYLMDAKAFEELLSLRAKLASVNANCDKAIITGIVDRYQKDTANYALVNRCAALEVQLAELRGKQEPIAYIIADKYDQRGYLSRKSAEAFISAEDINNHEITCTPLYANPGPPAAGQPYTVPDEEIKQALENITHENWRMCEVLRELLKKRPGGVYFTKWEPVIYEALNTPVTDACRAAMLAGAPEAERKDGDA